MIYTILELFRTFDNVYGRAFMQGGLIQAIEAKRIHQVLLEAHKNDGKSLTQTYPLAYKTAFWINLYNSMMMHVNSRRQYFIYRYCWIMVVG
nr:hypothetical protein [Tanacetum cinerariifolium]